MMKFNYKFQECYNDFGFINLIKFVGSYDSCYDIHIYDLYFPF